MPALANQPYQAVRFRPLPVERIAVTHVITSLATGGADMMLARLVRAMDQRRFSNSVISLCCGGAAADRIRAAGITVRLLGLDGGQRVRRFAELALELRRQKPNLIQTWMYHADLLGGLASVAVPGVPLLWNLRCGRLDPAIDKRSTIWISRVCAALSRYFPARILSCSEAAREVHISVGYRAAKMLVIPNGFDTDEFRPDATRRLNFRRELGLPPDTLLIGSAARFNGAKDHATFFEAAGRVHQREPRVQFVLCGQNVVPENRQIEAWAARAGVAGCCHLMGRRDDISRILPALDIFVSSSFVEGFPNALGEAMSCGVPCVSTDAGDSRRLVGERGFIVPVRDPAALAAAVLRMIDIGPEKRAALGALARRRISECFEMAAVARQYEQVYEEMTAGCVE